MASHKSAEELLSLRRKLIQAQMPCRSGPKDSVPDGSEEQAERLEQQLGQFEAILTEERILRKGNISAGKWNSEKRVAEIEIEKGVHWQVFGQVTGGKQVLQPEEALYMVDHQTCLSSISTVILKDDTPVLQIKNCEVVTHQEVIQGMLELYYNDLPMSVQQAYEMLLSETFHLYHYAVYSHLRNLGFIVLRHKRRNSDPLKDELFATEKLEKTEDMNLSRTVPPMIHDNPVLHYWKDEECRPLVHPVDSTSLENILDRLQIIKSQTMMEASNLMHGSTTSRIEITFDVFQPQKKFKKSDPGLPDHSVCVCKFSETPPSIGEINLLAFQSHPVPLKYAVVDGKDISFYSMLDVQLPTYTES